MTESGRGVIRVGTRGSLLARTQTGHVVAALSAAHPGFDFETVVIRTSGDRALRDVVGAFVKELQEALLSGEVDLAVHSMKDLPTDRPDGLTIAAVPVREDPREALISAHRRSPSALSSNPDRGPDASPTGEGSSLPPSPDTPKFVLSQGETGHVPSREGPVNPGEAGVNRGCVSGGPWNVADPTQMRETSTLKGSPNPSQGILARLPGDARIGTGSARRAAQLRNIRPDLRFLPLVGNVDTRMRKLKDGEYDAIVAAMAGLRRLDFAIVGGLLADTGLSADVLDVDTILPAPGQGALAVECRAADSSVLELLRPLDDAESHAAVRAERAFLAGLGGGCQTPVAAYATADGAALRLRGLVASLDGATVLRGETTGSIERPEELGRALAQELIARGAQGLLEGGGR